MRIVLTGGGTGGHILPNIAVIEALNELTKSKPKSAPKIFYVGEKNSIEEKIMEERGIKFSGIYAGKLRRYFDVKNILDVAKIPLGAAQAVVILNKIKPNLVFAKGGYVSVPVCLAAKVLGIPVWIHESDISPGLATRICKRFAEKIFLSFEESKKFFRDTEVDVHVVGNPIRKQILSGNREIGLKLAGLDHTKPVLLVMGGSTGAEYLNTFVKKNLDELLEFTQVIHITGPQKAVKNKKQPWGYAPFEYLNEDLAHVYAATDVVLTRAGAGSIFELLALNKPMILVPLPKAASRGDQIENAQVFARKGFAVHVDQEKTSHADILKVLKKYAENEKVRDEMIAEQKRAGLRDAALKIAREINSI